MTLLADIFDHNKSFVEDKKYEELQTNKYPSKKIVILTCMDTRLVELLPKAMNFKNGDVKLIKNAGATISHPFGSVMRSLLVAIFELKAEEVCVVGHYDCGMINFSSSSMLKKALDRGIKEETITTLLNADIDLNKWLEGFNCVEDSVKNSVQMIKKHPLFPNNIPVHGMVIDPETGKLSEVINGY
ncbi:MAG: carbonic anhydrase [Firmicutes bacterium]|nr:carbonic anhydrase [Bacillota bacterium]